MSVCLIAIFKNESSILKEWIDHYIKEGVDKFFLIDNGSDDNYHDILEPYINTSKVELVIDATRHKQSQHYNNYFLEKSKQYEWAIVCDLDEFIYSRNGFKTIKTYLNTVNSDVSQVVMQWKFFGSSGNIEQPLSVIKSFTKRANYDTSKCQGISIREGNKYSLSKSIARTKFLKSFDIHTHKTISSFPIASDNLTTTVYKDINYTLINEEILKTSNLHLNHYAIQSYSWFMKVKATRGSAATHLNDNVRNEVYFKRFDINDKEDLELSLKEY